MDTISEAVDLHRRHFLGATAVAVAAAQLGGLALRQHRPARGRPRDYLPPSRG